MEYFLVHVKVGIPTESAAARLEGFLTTTFGERSAYVAEDFGTGERGEFHAMMVGVDGNVNTTKDRLETWLYDQDPDGLGWFSDNPLHAPDGEYDGNLNRAVLRHWGEVGI